MICLMMSGLKSKDSAESADDILFDSELLANRGDHRSYEGIARELFARLGGKLELPAEEELKHLPPSDVRANIETQLCLSYSLMPFEILNPTGVLDRQSLLVLETSGIDSSHPVVDATNIANLEIGQPTHCFDAEAIIGTIRVRESLVNERALPLFLNEWVELPTGTVVIADDEKVLAIAGVIGCRDSAVTVKTRYVLLESACFDPVAVRKASKALKISTDASQRFERGGDPSMILRGGRRVAYLLTAASVAKAIKSPFLTVKTNDFVREIRFTGSQLNEFFDTKLDLDEVAVRLARYGYHVQRLSRDDVSVTTPAARYWDVSNRWDIFEDVAKAYSYSYFPEKRPKVDQGVQQNAKEKLLSAVRAYFVDRGFFEIFTNSFYSTHTRSKLVRDHQDPLWSHVETLNAIERNYSLLRNNCLAQALEAVHHNIRFNQHDLRLFEICNIFQPDPSACNGVCREREIAWGVMTGSADPRAWVEKHRPIEFWDIKGLMMGLAKAVRRPLLSNQVGNGSLISGYLHPYRQCDLQVGNDVVGIFGEVHPQVCMRFGIERTRVHFFEIGLAALASVPETRPRAKIPSARPWSVRSLNFVLSERVEATAVREAIFQEGPDWLREVEIVDVWLGGNEKPLRSVTFQLEFNNENSDHSTAEINLELERIVREVEHRFSEGRVTLRR